MSEAPVSIGIFHGAGSYVSGKAYNLLAWTIAIVISLLSLSLIVLTVLDWCGVKIGG